MVGGYGVSRGSPSVWSTPGSQARWQLGDLLGQRIFASP